MTDLLISARAQDAPVADVAYPLTAAAPLRVAAVPAAHPYVARVTDDEAVRVLPDPTPVGARPGQWWPPVILDPHWVGAHAAEADLLHIHFGTESFTPEHLDRTLRAARAAGWPVVVTVHDLTHPQLRDQRPYLDQLDVLVRGADALITLTPGAAEQIRTRWSREALVLAHPRLLGDGPVPVAAPHDELVVGMHLKDIRPNVDAVGATRALAAAASELAEAGTPIRAEVRLHRQVRDQGARDAVREIAGAVPAMVLIEHDRLSDAELAGELARLDACVLPYRHGTHSGWLELCWDLGVPVAAPTVGFYADQHRDGSVAGFDPEAGGPDLVRALRMLGMRRTSTRAGSPERIDQVGRRRRLRAIGDRQVSQAHVELYRRLLARERA